MLISSKVAYSTLVYSLTVYITKPFASFNSTLTKKTVSRDGYLIQNRIFSILVAFDAARTNKQIENIFVEYELFALKCTI